MNRHQRNPLCLGGLNQPLLSNEIGVMAKTEIGIDHGRGVGGFDNVGLRMRIHFSAAQVFEVEVQVTEADVADTFRFRRRRFLLPRSLLVRHWHLRALGHRSTVILFPSVTVQA